MVGRGLQTPVSVTSAVASFSDDLEASLAHLRLPVEHRLNCRTTNLVERSFVEERRRTPEPLLQEIGT
jgi:hypothetical protein